MAELTELQTRLARYGDVLDEAAQRARYGSEDLAVARHEPAPTPWWRAVAVGATALAVTAVAVVLVARGPAVDVPAATSPGSSARFLMDGWQVSATHQESGAIEARPGDHGLSFVQVWRDPRAGFDGPQVALFDMTGEDVWNVPPDATTEVVNGKPAAVYGSGALQQTVVWAPTPGRTLVLRGTRVPAEVLIEIVRHLRPAVSGPGWDATAMPTGLELAVARAAARPERYESSETTFVRGLAEVDLRVNAGDEVAFERLVDDRVNSAAELWQATVLGQVAAVVRYEASNEFAAMWLSDGALFEMRGAATSREAFLEALASLRPVPEDEWPAALPDRSVTPAQRSAEVDRMLAGVTLPPGFDSSRLRAGGTTTDRYQLGAQVAGAVACAWTERWVTARAAGDDEGAAAAVAAMSGSRQWPVLVDMADEGAFPQVVWQLADAMAGDGMVPAGRPMTVEEAAPHALGCPR
jgi:hypothetical protein